MDFSSGTLSPVTWHGRADEGGDPGAGEPLRSLPLATLYLTDRCNSRCVSCDYWRHGQHDMSLEAVARLLPSLTALGTREVLISGGEPLLNPQWAAIATLLRGHGLRLLLLSSGLALAKHAREIGALFESVTVSLDGTDRDSYAAIRGVDAFDKVCEGIRAAAQQGLATGLRVTVQRGNYRRLSRFVTLARELGASSISFLAADVSNPQAFGRRDGERSDADIALRADDLPHLAAAIDAVEREHADDFRSEFILESPAKLRRLQAYFHAICGLGDFPPVRCNAPEFSAVIEADGSLRPCFFISGPGHVADGDLAGSLNAPAMRRLRADIRAQARRECARCVCAKWRDPKAAELQP
jgi:MoaA/NifB/PqqE/SkfB family radical SAM enzyme